MAVTWWTGTSTSDAEQQTPARQLLQEAMHEEEALGNVTAAVDLYERVFSAVTAEEDAVAATAQLRLGLLYERLGRTTDAQRAFGHVVRDFADQVDQAAEARGRLAALEPPPTPAAAAEPFRRLTLDEVPPGARYQSWRPSWTGGSYTRDGHHVLGYDREQRAFELLEIESGAVRKLTREGPDSRHRVRGGAQLSPDGRLVAAVFAVVSREGSVPFPSTNVARWELRVHEVGGRGEGRAVAAWDEGTGLPRQVRLVDWSPGQDRVWLSISRSGPTVELAWADLADGSVHVLKTVSGRGTAASLSPDGRFIAYHDADDRDAPSDLFLLATDGSREVRIEHPAGDSGPHFAPDGSGVVFFSNRGGARNLWFLPVTDGRPAGDPRIVWADIGPYGRALAFTENGSVYYSFASTDWEIYTADLDLSEGHVGEPTLLERRNGEMNNAPAFSPDGRFLAHLRDRGRRLVLRELDGGTEREFPSLAYLLAPAIDWCPDGSAAIVTGYLNEATATAFRVDLRRGSTERLSLAWPERMLCVGPGGDIVYLRGGLGATTGWSTRPGQTRALVRRSAETGAETILFDGSVDSYPMARSLDGAQIAFVETDAREARLMVMPSSGGDARVVATSPVMRAGRPETEFQGVMWLPDGNTLLVARAPVPRRRETSLEVTFWRVPIDGRAAREVGRVRLPASSYGPVNFSVHPDGTRIAFERNTGLVQQQWAIVNLLQFIQSGASHQSPRR